jgi:hypothetical protein
MLVVILTALSSTTSADEEAEFAPKVGKTTEVEGNEMFVRYEPRFMPFVEDSGLQHHGARHEQCAETSYD